MSNRELPETVQGRRLLKQFPVNEHFQIGVFQGKQSKYDILIKYKQLINSGWTSPRTPKHIHWAIDILIKQYEAPQDTEKFLDFLISQWNTTCPIRTEEEREKILSVEKLLEDVNIEAKEYESLAKKGEYSIKFLILLLKLLMLQEKTNRPDAYIFKQILDKLKNHSEIFSIVSTATFRGGSK